MATKHNFRANAHSKCATAKAFGVASTRASRAPLRQHRLVKLVPIVKIVQVHRVFW
jgi:hypothetical protein